VSLEDATAAAKALGWIRQGMDFADGLHLAKAEGCEAFISFDQDFRESCQRPWRHQGADLATGAQRAHIWKVVLFEGLDSHGRRNDKEGQASPRPNASRATAR
jgi:hypothetical protein